MVLLRPNPALIRERGHTVSNWVVESYVTIITTLAYLVDQQALLLRRLLVKVSCRFINNIQTFIMLKSSLDFELLTSEMSQRCSLSQLLPLVIYL